MSITNLGDEKRKREKFKMFKKAGHPKTPQERALFAIDVVNRALTTYAAEIFAVEAMRTKAGRKYFDALERAKKIMLGQGD